MDRITCKFGGTSLASADAIRKAESIIRANPARRYIVPSAPGKRHADDIKVTDLFYSWHSIARQGLDPAQPRGMIADRFRALANDLGIDFPIDDELARISDEGAKQPTPDYMASRGEYLNGRLIAQLFGATFVDPADHIRFDDKGMLDPVSYDNLSLALEGDGLFVVPGFYGADTKGRIKTFSRGGSDVTGAIVARATKSQLYENWTDVSGFRMADPRIVHDARHIEAMTYGELRELSYMGAQVLHDEAIFPVREPGIAINIRNTNDPDHAGTMIVSTRDTSEALCGIAGRKGFSMINVEKTLMNKEAGFGLKLMRVLADHNIAWEHMATGIDTISLIVRDEELDGYGAAVLDEITRVCSPDALSLTEGLALIATVGQGMVHHVGVAARLFTALAEAGVNIRVIDQGSSEMNIIIGVDEDDIEKAVQAIYYGFETSAKSA